MSTKGRTYSAPSLPGGASQSQWSRPPVGSFNGGSSNQGMGLLVSGSSPLQSNLSLMEKTNPSSAMSPTSIKTKSPYLPKPMKVLMFQPLEVPGASLISPSRHSDRPGTAPFEIGRISSPKKVASLELLKIDIRRLHAAIQTAADLPVSGSGAYGVLNIKTCRSESGARAEVAAAAVSALSSGSSDAALEAELASSGSDRLALLELLSSKASNLMLSSARQYRSLGLDSGTVTVCSQELNNGTAPKLSRPALPLAGQGRSQSAQFRNNQNNQWVGSEGSGKAGSESLTSALLDAVAVMNELQRLGVNREAARRDAEERATDFKNKLEASLQDVTMLRNIVGELQASSSLRSEALTRASSARSPVIDAPQHPDVALLRQIQALNQSLSDARGQLDAVNRKAKLEAAEASSVSSDLDALRKALKLSQGKEQQVCKERDQSDNRCRQLESDLVKITKKFEQMSRDQLHLQASCQKYESDLCNEKQKCEYLASELDQMEKRAQAEAAEVLATAAAAAAQNKGAAKASQTDADERDDLLRSKSAEVDALSERLSSALSAASAAKEEFLIKQDALQKRVESLKSTLDTLLEDVDKAEIIKRQLSQELSEAKKRSEFASLQLDQSRKQLEELQNQHQDSERVHGAAMANLERTIEALRVRLVEAEGREGALQARLKSESEDRRRSEAKLVEEAERADSYQQHVMQLEEASMQFEDRLMGLKGQLTSKESAVQTLRQLLTEAQQRWERSQSDLEAERKRLEAEYKEAAAIRSSLQQEATTMKAMGALVQTKTMRFDISGLMKLPPAPGSTLAAHMFNDPSAISGASAGAMRPGSAAVMGMPGDSSAAVNMRLSNLVKELQEQVQMQALQLQQQMGAEDKARDQLKNELESLKKQETDLRADSHALRSKLEDQCKLLSESQVACADHRAREEDADRQRQEAVSKAAGLQEELASVKQKFEETCSRLSAAQEGNLALKSSSPDGDSLRSTVDSLRSTVDSLRNQLATLGDAAAEVTHLKAQVTHLQDQLKERAEQCSTKERELADVQMIRERLQKDVAYKTRSADKLAAELAEMQTAGALSLDYESLLDQLQAARSNLLKCSEKLERAESTIYYQDEQIASLQARAKVLEEQLATSLAASLAQSSGLTSTGSGSTALSLLMLRPSSAHPHSGGPASALISRSHSGGSPTAAAATAASSPAGLFNPSPTLARRDLQRHVSSSRPSSALPPSSQSGWSNRHPSPLTQGVLSEQAPTLSLNRTAGPIRPFSAAGPPRTPSTSSASSQRYTSAAVNQRVETVPSPGISRAGLPLRPYSAVPQASSSVNSRPSTAVARKTLVLLSKTTAVNIDEMGEPDDWTEV
ncbi:hypothetical protein CEUSTIGMA_g3581.t1 [Chlamydomonas eustigma]|uniref:Uncharacterized protein n=1 Tax=Chlamydomonas eustigma TaxID=1157962 RepID=A0A250WZ72_9CHLO|nr:hypothetical protein CEUSTIGMA_g3581.t1 [Chlamydomonas eustigma]|eukprot:GAX76138.1 hypothetical protein CEUSTIGMA_g3581.t1 [Chlamydomonas eustigma]